jgi:hypothetical protein
MIDLGSMADGMTLLLKIIKSHAPKKTRAMIDTQGEWPACGSAVQVGAMLQQQRQVQSPMSALQSPDAGTYRAARPLASTPILRGHYKERQFIGQTRFTSGMPAASRLYKRDDFSSIGLVMTFSSKSVKIMPL